MRLINMSTETFLTKRFRGLVFLAMTLLAIIPIVLHKLSVISLSTSPVKKHRAHRQETENGSVRLISDQACVHKNLEINHPSVAHFFQDVSPLVCASEPDWIYVENGTFKLSNRSRKQHGAIACRVTPYRFQDDFRTVDQNSEPIVDGTPLKQDFSSVWCNSSDGKTYFNLHSGISFNADAHARSKARPLPLTAMGVNILMLGFDSVSRMTMKRKLPKTVSYLTSDLKGFELEGYNIVGDGTPAALLPILTGLGEKEVPEARRGYAGAKPVDSYPWVWRDFEKFGYVSQWAEDDPGLGTFTYRMLGFSKPPVDHYMRPFYIKAAKYYEKFKPLCLGSMRRYANHLNWFRDLFLMYGGKRKFMFGFHGEYSHSNFNTIQHADEDTLELFRFLQEGGYLNNTILILMSDHGARFDKMRETEQGKLEERMPYIGFRFPPWFEQSYPIAMKNFRINVKRLTVPFDIHATFMDVLDYKAVHIGNVSRKGISLFREIPKERTCAHAGVKTHWCACLNWVSVSKDDFVGLAAVNELIQVINSQTQEHRKQCETLRLGEVTKMVKYSTNENVLKFKRSIGHTGKADISDKMSSPEDFYQVTFQTTPGSGLFEATVKYKKENKSFTVDLNGISRINKYGSDPSCIAKEFPHLRPYCYCKIRRPGT